MRLILANCNVIDCVHPDTKSRATVVIENGRIVEIRDGGPTSSTKDDQVVDLAGSYLLPGLWDVHIHPEHPNPAGTTVAQLTAAFGQNLQRGMIEAGVTAVRSGGAGHFMDVAWRRAFEGAGPAGPRVFACGYFLTTTGGHFLTSGHARECDGPYGYAEAIRDQIKHDVDHIKLNLSGGIMGPRWDRHTESFLLREEIETAFALCKQRNFPVMAHATNPESVKMAIKLGAHTVEHAYITDEHCITEFVSSGTWYVPTLSISQLSPSLATTEHEKAYAARKQLAPDLVVRARCRSRRAPQFLPESVICWCQDGFGIRYLPDEGFGIAGVGPVGQVWGYDLAGAVSRHQERRRNVRCWIGAWHRRNRKTGRPDSSYRQPSIGHRKPAKTRAGIERRSDSSRPPGLGHWRPNLRIRSDQLPHRPLVT